MIDMKNMQKMMAKMGISQEEIEAERVIIECENKKLVIENPSVMKVRMQGQESWQITGEAREENREGKEEQEDIKTIMEKTGASEEKAREALEENGRDLAEAILSLSQ